MLSCMGSFNEMLVVSSEGGQSIEGTAAGGVSGFAAAGESAFASMDLMLDRTTSDPDGVEVWDGPRVNVALLALFSATGATPATTVDDLFRSACLLAGWCI